jgi:hypothetical protein
MRDTDTQDSFPVRSRHAACCAGLALLWASTAMAPASAQSDEAVPATYVENCVGHDMAELHAGSDSALLDEGDRAQVHAAMLARYRQLAADGFAPTAIVLWRSPSFGWVYLTLKAHPDKPGKLCSSASFSAAGFDLTAPLLHKYFFGGRT